MVRPLPFFIAFFIAAVSSANECLSQASPAAVELHAEALAVGAAFTVPLSSAWSVGIDVSVGKHLGVDVTDEGAGIDTYATGYVAVRWTPDANWQAVISPIGFAGIVGNDFGTVYPSARVGLSIFWSRLGVGSELRVVRIAGGNGSGDYWVQWSPVRLALRL